MGAEVKKFAEIFKMVAAKISRKNDKITRTALKYIKNIKKLQKVLK